jgi:hypothetical protein
VKRWIDERRSQPYFVLKNAEWLEERNSLDIKCIAKRNETDYEMSRTSGKTGRRKMAFEGCSERKNAENKKSFEKLLAFLNKLKPLK